MPAPAADSFFSASLIRFAKDHGLTLTTAAIVQAAERRGIPCTLLNSGLILLGEGHSIKLINGTLTSLTVRSAVRLAGDKQETNRILASAALPIPRQRLVETEDQAVAAAEWISYPAVVKPSGGNQGKGVSVKLTTPDEVRHAFVLAREHDRSVLVEQYVTGSSYRLLVIHGVFAAAAQLNPPEVVGDGLHTVDELVEIANQDPRRGNGHENVLTLLYLDSEARRMLAAQGYSPKSVPGSGETVVLRANANLSTGARSVDVTEDIHPDNREMAVRAVHAIGLDVGGVDFITGNIRSSYRVSRGAICEVNASPGLRMHLAPAEGKPRDVAGAIIDMLFPPASS